MICAPEFEPFLAAAWQSADLKAPKVIGPPTRPLNQGLAARETGLGQLVRQVFPAIRSEVQIEVDRISVYAKEADGVAAHDQAFQPHGLKLVEDFGQSGFWVHRIESSQPRLPCAKTRFKSGCWANSALLKGPPSRARISGIAASKYFSSASCSVRASPRRSS